MVFVDTSFWIAIRYPRDAHHEEATELAPQYADASLLTSNHVLGEAWTWLRRQAGHRAALGLVEAVMSSKRAHVTHVSSELEETALRWLRKHDERAYSFVDATSFALMRSMKIREALAFDGDFAAAGFRELRP